MSEIAAGMRINLSSFLRLVTSINRKLMLVTILLGFCAASQAQQFSNKLFGILFDYPTEELTNVTFRAHASTDVSIALTNWTVVESDWITESAASGNSTLTSSNKVLATAPVQYFVVSASNEWGLVFSDVLATRPPRQNVQLRLR